MATLQRIVFFLVCAFLLKEIQTQSTNFHYIDEGKTESQSFKTEISLVKDKTSSVMGQACDLLRLLGLTCAVGDMSRKFMGRIVLDVTKRFVHVQLRMMYTVAYLCEKVLKCIFALKRHIFHAVIDALPPCVQRKLRVIINFFKATLELITEILRSIYQFTTAAIRCGFNLGECLRNLFDGAFALSMRIVKNIIAKTTDTTSRVFRLSESCPAPAPPPQKEPEHVIVQFGRCIYCAFQPKSRFCG